MVERLIDISNGALIGMCVLWTRFFLTSSADDAPKRLRQWTGVFMLVVGAQTLSYIVCSFLNPALVEDIGFSLTGGLLALPFAVFMMMELTRLSHVTFRCVVTHLSIPVLLSAAYMVQLLCNVHSTGSAQESGLSITLLLYLVWMGGYSSYYVYRFAMAAHRYEEIVGDIYADVEGRSINWLSRVLCIVSTIVVLFVVTVFLLDEQWTDVAYNIMACLFLMVLCYYISIMRDNEAIRIDEEPQTAAEPTEPETTEERHNDMLSSLKAMMVEQDLYLQPNLTRETAARALYTNHNELARRIKGETGMTFSQFVTSIRLEHAAELLTTTTMTVDEILYACAFRSKSTFYRQFTECYHCSPIEYRQNNKN